MLTGMFSRFNVKVSDPAGQELIHHEGVHYLDYIESISNAQGTRRYLEIGTCEGASLERIDCTSIAIDPNFRINRPVVGKKPQCHLYQIPSDSFFAEHDARAIIGGSIDLAFLDGMHHYEFLLRDFINTERLCHSRSLILLHDCLPPNFEMTNRDGSEGRLNRKYRHYWAGDVWKVVSILRKQRPDLTMTLLDCPPTVLVVISNLDPTSHRLLDRLPEIIAENATSPNDLENLKNHISEARPIKTKSHPAADLVQELFAKIDRQ